MNVTPQLFLVDGMSLLFRSFYAMSRARMNAPDGTPTGAIYGFLKIVVKIMKEKSPSHFAVTWDLPGKNFRHEMFPEYKSNRSDTPEELLPQIKLMHTLIPELGIPSLSARGFEGDDIIGTVAKRFATHGDVFIVTSDKDFMQLVNDRIKMFSLKPGDEYEIVGREHVKDYFGVAPEHVIDVLALKGDSVDFVPGVKGIGDKSAAKLVSEFGSLEGIYDNLGVITNKRTRELLESGKDSAFLSRKLVTIACDAPIECDEDKLRFDWGVFSTNEKVKERLNHLGMVTLVKQIFGSKSAWASDTVPEKPKTTTIKTSIFDDEGATTEKPQSISSLNDPAAPAITPAWDVRNYSCVRTKAELESIFARMVSPATDAFAFDTETTGLDFIEDKPIGFSVSFAHGEAYYIPAVSAHLCADMTSEKSNRECEFSAEDVWNGLKKAFAERKAVAVAHNLKFDLHQLQNVGVTLGDSPIACSMVAAWLLDSTSSSYGLDGLTLKHLRLEKIPTSRLIGKSAGRTSMVEVPCDLISEYGCEDADATLRLWRLFEKDITASNLGGLFWDMEMPLLHMLADMERTGVHIDIGYLNELCHAIQTRISEIESEVYSIAGQTFNIASPKQLGVVLFEQLKVHEKVGYKGKLAKTTLGYKTDASVLETFVAHPCVALVLEYRELSKLLGTYVQALPQLVKKTTGRIHTCFNQIGTATGRLSSTDPNLQNIPIRTELGKKVRAAFSASSNENVIVAADYSQIELRVLAHLSGDESMLAAFKAERDIHRETAAKLHNKNPEEITPEERSAAKAINFGIIYGMGAQRLAREQGVTQQQAKAFIEKYFLNFARIRDYLDSQKQAAYEHGFVSTFFGRPRRIYGLAGANPGEVRFLENIAINSPIQGTAADIMKIGMLRAYKALAERGLKSKIILQVHDELVIEGPRSEAEAVQSTLKEAMQGAVNFSVPLLVEVSMGKNWLEAK